MYGRRVLKVESIKVPRIERVVPTNEREVLDAAGGLLAALVRARAKASRGVNGPLPQAEDGNPGWVRTGALAASIGHVMKQDAKGAWRATVRPLGDIKDRDVGAIRAAARERTKALKAAAALGAALQVTAGGRGGALAASTLLRKRPGKGGPLALSKLKVRPVDTYAALAAVLSVRARTRPSRALYHVVSATRAEEAQAAALVQQRLRTELLTVDVGTITRGLT